MRWVARGGGVVLSWWRVVVEEAWAGDELVVEVVLVVQR